METESSLYELIERQLAEQEKNYETAVINGKSARELREIEYHVEYLKSCLERLKKDYNISSINGLSMAD
jgi:hypothetical protein